MPKRHHLKRYRQIIRVLIRNGFGIMLEQLGVLSYLRMRRFARTDVEETAKARLNLGERLRLSCEELGPTFVKIGQILSTRPDILTPEVSEELSKLQDAVNPFPYADVRLMIEQEFGEPLEQVFEDFEEQPMAAASLSQVHRAFLPGRQEVVVKVQRPGIRDSIRIDLEILRDLVSFVSQHTHYGELYDFNGMLDELDRTLNNELDFRKEGENADRFDKNKRDEDRVAFPVIRWIYTTERVLTMSLETGTRISQVDDLKKSGLDTTELGLRLSRCMVHQVLEDGFFHADPHPGNILVRPDGTLVFLDLGMIGKLSDARRQTLSELFVGIAAQDAHQVVQAFVDMDTMRQRVNLRRFEAEISKLLDKYLSLPINEIQIGELLSEIFRLAFVYRVRIPGEFTLIAKVLITLQGIIENLDPDLNLLVIMKPVAAKMIRQSFSISRLAAELQRSGADYKRMIQQAPGFLVNFFQKMEDDEYRFSLDLKDINKVQKHFDNIGNRISFSLILLGVSIIIAGIIIGASMNASALPELMRFNIWLLRGGLALAAAILLGLAISMFRSKRF
jgi:ubiquinone biosynthesis protein